MHPTETRQTAAKSKIVPEACITISPLNVEIICCGAPATADSNVRTDGTDLGVNVSKPNAGMARQGVEGLDEGSKDATSGCEMDNRRF